MCIFVVLCNVIKYQSSDQKRKLLHNVSHLTSIAINNRPRRTHYDTLTLWVERRNYSISFSLEFRAIRKG